ncbi:MAG: protein BatD [Gemmatimonadetes bacterium]|nr:protein BatD [Gemmatimonadota bacterium]MYD14304.1 protein BatD [Gemmatimonadota bacterium]MYI65399.1 protein BatD [Gemmatimonadota bacterium]
MVEMRRSLWVRLMRAGPVGLAAGFVFVGGTLSAQEPGARAYLESPEVEIGEQFTLKIEVTGVGELEEVMLPDRFPFAVAAYYYMRLDITDDFPPDPRDVLPYTLEITPATAQSAGSVTVSYSLVAREAGFFEFDSFRIAAAGRTLETEPVMLLVRPPSEPTAARAWIEPPEVKLMEHFTLFVEAPGLDGSARVDVPDVSEFATGRGVTGALSSRQPAFYRFVALRPGTHEVGPVEVQVGGEVYEIEPVTLVVSDEHRQIEAHAGVNTEQAWVGGEFALVVEVAGAREFDEDPELPDISAFAERQRGGGQGRSTFSASRDYHFLALRPGVFEIGPVTVKAAGQTILTEPVRITIAEGPPDPVAVPEDLRTTAVADKRRVYVGEPVLVSYRLLARDVFRGFEGWSVRGETTFTPPVHEDLQVHDLGRQPGGWRRFSVDDRSYRAAAEHFVSFVALETGEKVIDPAQFRVQVNRRSLSGSRAQLRDPTGARTMGNWTPMTLTTDPISVEVVPLPTEGRPESFRGHVGRVEVASRLNRSEAEVGDTVTLRVEMTGDAYLRLMPEPEIILPDGFDIFGPEVSDDPRRLAVGQPGERTLVYRLVPNREGSYRIAAVEVAWFNPGTGEYGVSRAEPFEITVGPAGRG